MDEFIFAVANVGFPAFLCVYLVTKFDATISRLIDSVNANTEAINRLESAI